jgi:hypothetical protein
MNGHKVYIGNFTRCFNNNLNISGVIFIILQQARDNWTGFVALSQSAVFPEI